MKISNEIIESLNKDSREEFYYKANDVEQELFKLRDIASSDKKLVSRIEQLIIELNNIRMDGYNSGIKESSLSSDDSDIELINKIDSSIKYRFDFNGLSYDIEDKIYIYYDDIPKEYYDNKKTIAIIRELISNITDLDFKVDYSYSVYDGEPMYNLSIVIDRGGKYEKDNEGDI